MMNAAPLHATWMAVSPQLLCNIAKREREEQEMSNIIDAISRTIEPRVQQAAQRTATDNRAQIAREIEAAKGPEKLKELANRYILDAPRNQKTPGNRLQSPANSENVVPQGPGGFGARPNNPYSRLELLAEKGHLKPGETYPLSFSTGQEKTSTQESSARNASKSSTVLVEDNSSALRLAGTGRTVTQGDGSSPRKPIAITSAQILESVSVNGILDGVGADAFVIAVRGKIGVQNIPGWNKIPGLKELGKDAEVGYLVATLTPFDVTSRSVRPLQTTLFLSVTVPGQKPLIITTKLSDLNVEMGRPIKNEVLFGGKIILFSNWRLGVTGKGGPDGVASANGGILFRVNGLKRTVSQVQRLVKRVARAAEAAEAAAAAATAPETAATSLAAGAATMAATELARGTVSNSLDLADWYLGLAWRGSINAGIHEGSVTLKAQKGALAGKWVIFKLADIPGAIFDSKTPDFEAPNREYLNTDPLLKNLKPEIKDALARGLVKHEAKPLLEQLISYLNIDSDELVDWLNRCDTDWVERFATYRMDQLEPGPDGRYPLTRSPTNFMTPHIEINSIPDLVSATYLSTQPQIPNHNPRI